MIIVLDSNKSCNKEITKSKDYNNNLILDNLVIIIINTTLSMYTLSHNQTKSYKEIFASYFSNVNDKQYKIITISYYNSYLSLHALNPLYFNRILNCKIYLSSCNPQIADSKYW